MKVKTIKPVRLNGVDINEGTEIEIEDSLAGAWSRMGLAVPAGQTGESIPGPPVVKEKDPNDTGETDDDQDKEIIHVGGGYYQLPNGEKVKGKENALKELKKLTAQE